MITQQQTNKSNVAPLVLGAICLAMATVLSRLPFQLPQGGGINGSMLPIVLYSFKENRKWGFTVSATYALIQLLTGFYPPPAATVGVFGLTVFLDYILAFAFLGAAGTFYRFFKRHTNPSLAMIIAIGICYLVRFFASFASGVVVWAAYAPQEIPVWLYSLQYNGGYMLAEFVLAVVVVQFASKQLQALVE